MPRVDVPRAVLEAELAAYLAEPFGPPDARTVAARHRVLPLFNDFMGCWALEMNGSNAALALGSRRFPALAAIRPARPPDAVVCTTCDGSGRLAEWPENVVCACGGLGWLPPSSRGGGQNGRSPSL